MGEVVNGKDDGIRSNKVENLMIDSPIGRTTDVADGRQNSDSYSGIFQTTYKDKNTFFYSQLGLKYSKSFSEETSNIAYSSYEQYNSSAAQNMRNKEIAPTLNLFFRKDIKANSQFEAKLTYGYLNRKYNRKYEENNLELNNDIKENAYKVDGSAKWNYGIDRNNSLSVLLWNVYSYNENRYLNGSENDQRLESNDFLLYPTYTYSKVRKFYLSLQAGFNVCHNSINSYSYTKVYPRPAVTLNYYMSKTNSLFMDVRMGSTIPLLSRMNSAEQQINSLRGCARQSATAIDENP